MKKNQRTVVAYIITVVVVVLVVAEEILGVVMLGIRVVVGDFGDGVGNGVGGR